MIIFYLCSFQKAWLLEHVRITILYPSFLSNKTANLCGFVSYDGCRIVEENYSITETFFRYQSYLTMPYHYQLTPWHLKRCLQQVVIKGQIFSRMHSDLGIMGHHSQLWKILMVSKNHSLHTYSINLNISVFLKTGILRVYLKIFVAIRSFQRQSKFA